ncbi:MAG: hypothetical protein ACP5FN_03155 [Candidatus Micrarchaeia archaeon]
MYKNTYKLIGITLYAGHSYSLGYSSGGILKCFPYPSSSGVEEFCIYTVA